MMMNKYLVCVKHLNSICSPSVMFVITVINFTSAATVNCSYFPEFTTTKETVYYKSVNGMVSWAVTMCILVHMYQFFLEESVPPSYGNQVHSKEKKMVCDMWKGW
jgi:hypothetical protein